MTLHSHPSTCMYFVNLLLLVWESAGYSCIYLSGFLLERNHIQSFRVFVIVTALSPSVPTEFPLNTAFQFSIQNSLNMTKIELFYFPRFIFLLHDNLHNTLSCSYFISWDLVLLGATIVLIPQHKNSYVYLFYMTQTISKQTDFHSDE